MHCFIWATAVVVALLSSSHHLLVNAQLQRGLDYQERDTARNFYSFGYRDKNAARAEYTRRDGSSRGFYSYVDLNGKQQNVKYETGRHQGFKAEATNLPKAAVDDQKEPEPVKETAQGQQAKELYLKALREAEVERANEQRYQSAEEEEEQKLSADDANILEQVRAELMAMLAEQQAGRNEEEEESKVNSQKTAEEDDDGDNHDTEASTTPRSEAGDDLHSDLYTVYTLADISSNSYLKLGELSPGRLLESRPKKTRLD